MKYKEIDLNGTKLRYVQNKISKTSVVDICFDCGARCDTIPGLAHFTEHMFFTGTNKLNKDQVTKKYFDFINVNAYTNGSKIYFGGNVFSKELDNYLETVAMLINDSTFSQDNVNKEYKVVQQEIARNNDKFQRKAYEFNDYNLTKLPLFKNEVLGSKESVASIKSKDVKNFVKKYFVKENCEIFVSSPYTFNKVKDIVQKKLVNKLPSSPKFKKLPLFFGGDVVDDAFFEIKHTNIDKCYLFINFLCNRNRKEWKFVREFALVLDMMNDTSEGIMKQLRLKKSLVYGGGFTRTYDDKNLVVTFKTECDKENVNEVIKTVAEYLKDLQQNGFSEAQLKKAKREYLYDEDYKEPSTEREITKLYDYKLYGKIIDEKWLKKLTKQTTLNNCNKHFKEVFVMPRVSFSLYGNATKAEIMNKREFNSLFKNN